MKLIQMTSEFRIQERDLMEKMIHDWLICGTDIFVHVRKDDWGHSYFYLFRPVELEHDIRRQDYYKPGADETTRTALPCNAKDLGLIQDIDTADLYHAKLDEDEITIILTPCFR